MESTFRESWILVTRKDSLVREEISDSLRTCKSLKKGVRVYESDGQVYESGGRLFRRVRNIFSWKLPWKHGPATLKKTVEGIGRIVDVDSETVEDVQALTLALSSFGIQDLHESGEQVLLREKEAIQVLNGLEKLLQTYEGDPRSKDLKKLASQVDVYRISCVGVWTGLLEGIQRNVQERFPHRFKALCPATEGFKLFDPKFIQDVHCSKKMLVDYDIPDDLWARFGSFAFVFGDERLELPVIREEIDRHRACSWLIDQIYTFLERGCGRDQELWETIKNNFPDLVGQVLRCLCADGTAKASTNVWEDLRGELEINQTGLSSIKVTHKLDLLNDEETGKPRWLAVNGAVANTFTWVNDGDVLDARKLPGKNILVSQQRVMFDLHNLDIPAQMLNMFFGVSSIWAKAGVKRIGYFETPQEIKNEISWIEINE